MTARLARNLAMASLPNLGCIRTRFVPRDSHPRDLATGTTQVRPTAGLLSMRLLAGIPVRLSTC